MIKFLLIIVAAGALTGFFALVIMGAEALNESNNCTAVERAVEHGALDANAGKQALQEFLLNPQLSTRDRERYVRMYYDLLKARRELLRKLEKEVEDADPRR